MSRLSQEEAKRILDEHNCARARYNAGLLKWDWNLAADAQVHADRCGFWHASAIGKLPGGQGENLSISTGTVGTGGWVAEERVYDCKTGNCRGPPCGHWTQMIWNDTDRVGCAVQRCKNGTVDPAGKPAGWVGAELLVCRYAPPGNYRGQQPVGSTQCDQGAQNRSCGDRSRFPTVSDSGRGVGVIVPKNVAATPAAGASKANQSGLNVWKATGTPNAIREALDKRVPLSIVDWKDTKGQEVFPWPEQKTIVEQYSPEDIKWFIDNIIPTPERLRDINDQEIIAGMAQVERRRQARGTIYVRKDQRAKLDQLPPQHLSPLLAFMQGVPTFHHATLVDRFFDQLQKRGGGAKSLSNVASGREQLGSAAEQELARKLAGDAAAGPRLEYSALQDQESFLLDRAAQTGVDFTTQKGTEKDASITTAYVLDAQKEERDRQQSARITLLIAVSVAIVLSVGVYFGYKKWIVDGKTSLTPDATLLLKKADSSTTTDNADNKDAASAQQ